MWSYLEIAVNRADGEYAEGLFRWRGINREGEKVSKRWPVKIETFWQYLWSSMKV